MRVAVVGHVEWVQFARVDHVPVAGEIVHSDDWWELPAGGGAGAAGQLAKLAGDATLYTALGGDDLARRVVPELEQRGISVQTTFHPTATRRAFTHVDRTGERTITVQGKRLEPASSDPLAWSALGGTDAVYVTAGDAEAVRLARSSRVLVGTSRILSTFRASGIQLDALVGSSDDASEAYTDGDLDPPPLLSVRTEGGAGGTFQEPGGPVQRYEAAPLPGPVHDRYGAGDSFAGALAFGLAAGMMALDAIALAARCAASVLTKPGPYEGQLTLAEAERALGRA